MIRSCVEGVKVVEYRFHFRSFCQRKSHGLEYLGNFLHGYGYRVLGSQLVVGLARFGNVYSFSLKSGLSGLFFNGRLQFRPSAFSISART